MRPKHIPTFTCQQCGIVYARYGRNPGLYCSRACFYAASTRPEHVRFWEKVDCSGGPAACWLWTGTRTNTGYGQFVVPHNRRFQAHRYAWHLANGPIPAGMFICHHCDNPPCVNPAHLWPGTVADNNRDRSAKGRSAVGERSGARTHPQSRPRGEGHWNASFSDSQIREIRRFHALGHSCYAIAKLLGRSRDTIEGIVRRESWEHL